MTRKNPKNTAASVRSRLLNLSRQSGEEFQRLLTRYAVERLLDRLFRSEHAARCKNSVNPPSIGRRAPYPRPN